MPATSSLEHAARWRALLVGIEHYPQGIYVSDLKRPVPDVVRAARWLLAAGVPAERITVHVSSSEVNEPLVQQLNVDMQARVEEWACKSATLSELYATLSHLRREPKTADDRLLVILSGHGLYLPDGGRVLLTEEYDGDDALTNVSLTYIQRLLAGAGYRDVSIVYAACANSAYQAEYAATIKPGWPAGRVPPADPAYPAPMFTFHASRVMEFASEVDNKNLFLDSVLECLESTPSTLRDFDPIRGVEALNMERFATFVRTAVKVHGFEPWPEWGPTPDRLTYMCAWQVPTATLSIKVNPDAVHDSIDYVRVEQIKPYRQEWPLAAPAGTSFTTRVPQGASLRTHCPLKFGVTGWHPIQQSDQFVAASTSYVCNLSFEPVSKVDVAGKNATYELVTFGPDGQEVGIPASITDELDIDRFVGDETFPLVAGVTRGQVLQLQFRAADHTALEAANLLWQRATKLAARSDLGVTVGLRHTGTTDDSGLRLQPPERGWTALLGPGELKVDEMYVRQALDHMNVLTVSRAGNPVPVKAMTSRELRRSGDGLKLSVEPGVYEVQISLPWGQWLQTVSVPPGVITPVHLPEQVGDMPLRHRLVERPDAPSNSTWILCIDEHPFFAWMLGGERHQWLERWRAPIDSRGLYITLDDDDRALLTTLEFSHGAYTFPVVQGRGLLVAANRPGRKIWVEPYSHVDDIGWDTLVALGHLEDLPALPPNVLSTLLYAKQEDGLLGLAGGYALQLGSHGSRRDRLVVTNNLLWARPGIDAELLYVAARLDRTAENTKASLFPDAYLDQEGEAWDRKDHLLERIEKGEIPLFRWGIDLALVIASRPELKLSFSPQLERWKQLLSHIAGRLVRNSVWTVWVER